MSTSNFMIFQGVEYHKTGNATNTLDCFPIIHASVLFFCCFQLTSIPILIGKVVFFLRVWVHLTWLVSSLCNRTLFFLSFHILSFYCIRCKNNNRERPPQHTSLSIPVIDCPFHSTTPIANSFFNPLSICSVLLSFFDRKHMMSLYNLFPVCSA